MYVILSCLSFGEQDFVGCSQTAIWSLLVISRGEERAPTHCSAYLL